MKLITAQEAKEQSMIALHNIVNQSLDFIMNKINEKINQGKFELTLLDYSLCYIAKEKLEALGYTVSETEWNDEVKTATTISWLVL